MIEAPAGGDVLPRDISVREGIGRTCGQKKYWHYRNTYEGLRDSILVHETPPTSSRHNLPIGRDGEY
ncbi:hypothetical protein [Kitasatospora griseola]|uniref:hypothetical protein n=1 Tax=Kitasatospora griseola TaxID=2064 RepID=UPI0037FD6781